MELNFQVYLKQCLLSLAFTSHILTRPMNGGTNENHNGIIRRFIPKGVLISSVEEKQIRFINNWMNDYPRRLLGYLTPLESLMMHLMA